MRANSAIGLAKVRLQISRDRDEHLTEVASENVVESEAASVHEASITSPKLAVTVVAVAVPLMNKEMAKYVTSVTGSAKGLSPQVSQAHNQPGVWIDR